MCRIASSCSAMSDPVAVSLVLYSLLSPVSGPQCEFYNPDGICRLFGSIGYDYIYTDTSVKAEQVYEDEIGRVNTFVSSQGNQECADLIMDMLCHHYFPACDLSQPDPQPIEVNAHMLSRTPTYNSLRLIIL